MEKHLFTFLHLLSLVFATLTSPPRVSKHYRSDYVYNPKTDAFYKFHSESRRGSEAGLICTVEGSSLMLVESEEDIVQAHGMFKKYPDLPEKAWLADDGQHHASAEEQPLIYISQEDDHMSSGSCTMLTRKGEIDSFPCYQLLPFICKVKANDAYYDSHCGVYGTGYVYIHSVGSCYKIPSSPYSWNEAYAECRASGAHLLVVNSLAESQAVLTITSHTRVLGSTAYWFYFAGFRATPPQGNETLTFRTIFNQTLEEAGYSEWSPNEPNNSKGNEYCGAFFNNNGKLNDLNCVDVYGFICEKEVKSSE